MDLAAHIFFREGEHCSTLPRKTRSAFTSSAKPCNYCYSARGPPRPAPPLCHASHARRGRRRAPWGSVSGRVAPAPRVGRRRRGAHSPARARTGPVGGAPRASPAARRAPSARLAVDATHGVQGARSPRRAAAVRDGQTSVPAGYGAPPNLRVISSVSWIYDELGNCACPRTSLLVFRRFPHPASPTFATSRHAARLSVEARLDAALARSGPELPLNILNIRAAVRSPATHSTPRPEPSHLAAILQPSRRAPACSDQGSRRRHANTRRTFSSDGRPNMLHGSEVPFPRMVGRIVLLTD